MRYVIRLVVVLCGVLAGLDGGPASAEKRLALSVGIDAYDNLPADAQLKKAVNDARAVSAAFSDLGFDVTVEENVPKLAFTRAWTQFLNRLQPGDTAALFFAGHGAVIGGLNYLWPRDVPKVVRGEDKVLAAASIRFNDLMDELQDKKVRVALFIIDACRDNPFRDSRGRSYVGGTRGLVAVDPARGIFVMYSAGVREQALDELSGADKDANSPYTRTLLPLLRTPGLSLPEIARRVRSQVAALSLQAKPPHEQTPAYYDNLLGDFLLKPGAAPEPKPVVVPQPQLSETERAWAAIKDTTNIPALEAYRQHYGKDNPVYDRLAAARIEDLKRQQVALLKAEEQDRKRVEDDKKEEDRKESERQRQAALKAEEDRKRADEAKAYYNSGASSLDKRDYDRAIADFTKAIEINPKDGDAYGFRGLAYTRKDNYDLAIADFTKVIEINPKDGDAYRARGIAYGRKDNYDRAIADFTKAIEINPKDGDAYGFRGLAYTRKDNYDLAIADFTKVIEINPQEGQAYRERGIAYGRKDNYDRAIADFTKAIEINPKDRHAYGFRGVAYTRKDNYDLAIADFTKVIEINPQDGYAYRERGSAYYMKSSYDRAVADLTKAIEINAKDGHAYRERGNAYTWKNNYDRAIADFTKAIEINPQDGDAYRGRGDAHTWKDKSDRAIADYTKAIEINPQDSDAYRGRGSAYHQKRSYDRAIADYTMAIEINPQDGVAYGLRGAVEEIRGRTAEAIRDYRRALEIDPNDRDSRAALRRLRASP